MGPVKRVLEISKRFLYPSSDPSEVIEPIRAPTPVPVKGIMFTSKPRGAKDDIVRTADTREEAQSLAKTSALIVSNKSKFLPRSGVSVRSRPHVIFDFENNKITLRMALTSQNDCLEYQIALSSWGVDSIQVHISPAQGDLKEKRRAEFVEILKASIESLPLLSIDKPAFENGVAILQSHSDRLLKVAREKIDERQRPHEAELANTAEFQKKLDQLPKGSFVVRPNRGFGANRKGVVSIHDGVGKLKLRERIYVLTKSHAGQLSEALNESSAHARLTAMRLLEAVPDDHPLALPPDVEAGSQGFIAAGDLLGRLEMLEEMSEEETLGEVYIVNPRMIDTHSSYRLPYGYEYRTSWEKRLSATPLALTRGRSSLPKRPVADLIVLDGILCISDKAKSVLEGLDLGGAQFHFIDGTDDYWAVEITEIKEGPLPDEGLYEETRDGQRAPLKTDGGNFFCSPENLSDYSQRARFGSRDLQGPDIWLCEDLRLDYKAKATICISEHAVNALKKGKCKWYKRVYAARVVDE